MAILSECPTCHRKQSVRNRKCNCGEDLVKAKRSNRIRYWINFRLPDGKQRREAVGFSIEEARDADGKRRSQKRENRIFDMLPESKMSFGELSDWYLSLKKVKKLKSYNRVNIALKRFNEVFGDMIVGDIKNEDLEEYQDKRDEQGVSPATIDMEISIAQTMITKAFDNDKIDGRTLKAFRKTDRVLKKGSNARERIVSIKEYTKLVNGATAHLKDMLNVAYNTGMRVGEIRTLRWAYIDLKNKFIRLPEESTKESKPKDIPINYHVLEILTKLKPSLEIVDEGYHDFVFTFKGNPIKSPGGLRRSFATACRRAGIPFGENIENGLIFKDFRRSVKTNMVAAGVSKVYRDAILGHSLKGMDVHYIKPPEDALTQAMEKYTQWLDGQLESASVDQNVDQKRK